MNKSTFTYIQVASLSALLLGCPSDDDPGSDDDGSGSESGTDSSDGGDPTGIPDGSSSGDPDGSTGTETGPGTDTGVDSSTGEDPFVFEDADPADYEQADRAGFPGTNTAMNLNGDKDAYNAASPEDDVAFPGFIDNFADSIRILHFGTPDDPGVEAPDGLRDDLQNFGVAAFCEPPPALTNNIPVGSCLEQDYGPTELVGPIDVALPDVIKIDTAGEPGWVVSEQGAVSINGRLPANPVMPLLFGMLILDTSMAPAATFALFDLDENTEGQQPLIPVANDVDLPTDFPYLAPAHD